MARSSRSAALLDMHRRPSSRKRVSTLQRLRLIADAHALLWRHAIDLALDGEQHIDALDRLDCDRCLVDLCKIEEFAPRMGPAGGLHDRPRLAGGLVEPVEAGIGVRLHQSDIASQMLLGMLAAAIARIEEHRRWWIGAGKRPVVAHVGP